MTKITLLGSIFLLFGSLAFAQSRDFKKSMRQGIKEFNRGRLATAAQDFETAYQEDTSNLELRFLLGASYLHSDKLAQYDKALSHIRYVANEDPNYHPELQYMYGRALQYSYEFDEAVTKYKEFLSQSSGDNKVASIVQERIDECKVGKELYNNPEEVQVFNAGPQVNSAYRDYMPAVTQEHDLLVFTSNRDNIHNKTDNEGDPYEDVFVSRMTEDAEWSSPQNMGEDINTKHHDASVFINLNGTELYLYRDGQEDILRTTYNDGRWTSPEPLEGHVNTEHAELSASFTGDSKVVYFNSDRPGGFGGLDIYKAVYDDAKGAWGEPINLGPTINTKENEESPFIHPEGHTLYFSSKGHQNMGGYDVFVAEKTDGGEWKQPENMGYPINSPNDDLYFVVFDNKKFGYLSSRRPGGQGNIDIYQVALPGHKDFEEMEAVAQEFNFGVTTDKEEALAMSEEVLDIIDPDGLYTEDEKDSLMETLYIDTEEQAKMEEEEISNRRSTHSEPHTEAAFKIAGMEGDKDDERYQQVKDIIEGRKPIAGQMEDEEMADFQVKAGEEGKEEQQQKPREGGCNCGAFTPGFVLGKVYFELDADAVHGYNKPTLNMIAKIMKDYPELQVDVVGHTDYSGPDGYNNQLSLKRGQSVVNYLVGKGINSDRLSFTGQGESKPFTPRKDAGGMQLNRRVELVVK